MLRGWVPSGFNVHRSRRVLPEQREAIERLAQYIIGNPFSLDKMQVNEPDRRGFDGSVMYRSAMNVKIQRNFEVFTPSDTSPPSPSTSLRKASSLSATMGGTPIPPRRDVASATSAPPRRPWPHARPSRSSTYPSTSPAASLRPSGANSSIHLRQSYGGLSEGSGCGSAAPSGSAHAKCGLSLSSTTERSSSASYATLGCGTGGTACIRAPTLRTRRSSIRGSTIPSLTSTPNRSWRLQKTDNPGNSEVCPGTEHFAHSISPW